MIWYVSTPDGRYHPANECMVVALEPVNNREHTEAEIERAFREPRLGLHLVLDWWFWTAKHFGLIDARNRAVALADPSPAGPEEGDAA